MLKSFAAHRMLHVQFYRMLKRKGKRLWTDLAYRLACMSGLFDEEYYLRSNPDIDPMEVDPLGHYLDLGWRESRNPNQLFENDLYRRTYLADNDQNPLLHYIRTGWRSGCRPVPLFFSREYVRRYQLTLTGVRTPLAHYLKHWRRGFNPNPLFDSIYYLKQHPELDQTGEHPLAHYLRRGSTELFSPYPLFDLAYYLEVNPAVAREWQYPLLHYLAHADEEGCRPHRLFDPLFYRDTCLDASTPLLEAFVHYVEHGVDREARPNPLFDPKFYRQTSMEDGSDEIPLAHYLRLGVAQGAYPCPEVASLARKPVISILTPVYNTEANLLRRCVHSVLYQPYPHWELCLVDDGSSADHLPALLEAIAQSDHRIKVRRLTTNQGIAAATNAAAALAEGEYLAFLDHDDELAPDALYRIAAAINEASPDVLYSDEDLVNLESRHLDTFYKPAFNRELLRGHNYITHFLVTRRELFHQCGGLSSAFDGAQDYDLALKLTEGERKVAHIPRSLYRWRAHDDSTSVNHAQKRHADENGRRALQAALDREGIAGEAELTDLRFFYWPRRTIKGLPAVSVVVCGQPAPSAWQRLVRQIAAAWANVEVLAMAGGIENGQDDANLRLLPPLVNESEPAWHNRAAKLATGDYLCFVDGAVGLADPAWLRALIEYGQEAQTGMVGGCLEEGEGAHIHRGSLPDLTNPSWLYYASFVRDVSVHHNGIHWPQQVLAVHAGLCLTGRDRFLECGGYDPAFATMAFAQLDYCFRLHHLGLTNVFTPHAAAGLPGVINKAAGYMLDEAGNCDRALFQQRWYAQLLAGDPWHSRHLLADKGIPTADFARWYAGEGQGATSSPFAP